jgi:hypothetical protein
VLPVLDDRVEEIGLQRDRCDEPAFLMLLASRALDLAAAAVYSLGLLSRAMGGSGPPDPDALVRDSDLPPHPSAPQLGHERSSPLELVGVCMQRPRPHCDERAHARPTDERAAQTLVPDLYGRSRSSRRATA